MEVHTSASHLVRTVVDCSVMNRGISATSLISTCSTHPLLPILQETKLSPSRLVPRISSQICSQATQLEPVKLAQIETGRVLGNNARGIRLWRADNSGRRVEGCFS